MKTKVAGVYVTQWFFKTTEEHVPENLRQFSMTGRQLDEGGQTFESMCKDIETAYAQTCNELLCECCAGAETAKCAACVHARGWHTCGKDRQDVGFQERAARQKWKAGSLHNRKLDVEGVLWVLARRLVPLEVLKQKVDKYVAQGDINAKDREEYVELFEEMQGIHRQYNVHRGEKSDDNPPGDNTDKENQPMTT